jgi:MFS family permease
MSAHSRRPTTHSERSPRVAGASRRVLPGWLTPKLLRVLAAASSWGFAYSSFFLLPKFMTQELAAGPAEIGFVVGLFGIATVAFTPVAGSWVDRYPRRESIAGGALLMAGASLGFVAVDSVGPAMAALRFAQGVSYALVVTGVSALVVDLAPVERLSQVLGLAGASMLVMNSIAPAVVEPLAAHAGWDAAFVVAALFALLAVALAAGIEEPRSLVAGSSDGTTLGLRTLLGRPLARHYAAILALAGGAYGAVFTFEPAYALSIGRDTVGGFFAGFALGALSIRFALGHLPDRLGRYRVASVMLAAHVVVLATMAVMRPWMLELLGAALGLAHGLFYPSLNAIAVSSVAPRERGRMLALFTGAFNVGLWGGTTLMGFVAEGVSLDAVFLCASSAAATGLVVLLRSRPLRAAGRRQDATPSSTGVTPAESTERSCDRSRDGGFDGSLASARNL